jgi:hypothetical protein
MGRVNHLNGLSNEVYPTLHVIRVTIGSYGHAYAMKAHRQRTLDSHGNAHLSPLLFVVDTKLTLLYCCRRTFILTRGTDKGG